MFAWKRAAAVGLIGGVIGVPLGFATLLLIRALSRVMGVPLGGLGGFDAPLAFGVLSLIMGALAVHMAGDRTDPGALWSGALACLSEVVTIYALVQGLGFAPFVFGYSSLATGIAYFTLFMFVWLPVWAPATLVGAALYVLATRPGVQPSRPSIGS